jgi:predicted secreted Zn-dependent protease
MWGAISLCSELLRPERTTDGSATDSSPNAAGEQLRGIGNRFVDILFPGVDNNRSKGAEARGDMAAGLNRSVPGLGQADDEAMDAMRKVVQLLLDAIQNESLAALIAVHHVVMHKNLHGLSFSNQRIDNNDR